MRDFLARLLGWTSDQAVDGALRWLEHAAAYRSQVVVSGAGDLVPVAHALHRRVLGADRPFVVCDPHRRDMRATVRSPANHGTGAGAFEAAAGGSLCVRSRRLPRDFPSLVPRLRGANDVLLVVCADPRDDVHPLLVRPGPIAVPPLAGRAQELPRIVDEYAADAIAELRALRPGFTDVDRDWVLRHAATSLAEIEKATLRLVALRASRTLTDAAARLGMAPASLTLWISRRRRKTARAFAAT